MRDLASVVTIKEVWELKGKDRVQGANFVENGYEVMVGKDIQPGELVAFIQEGAILPEIEQWEFLRKRCFKEGVGFVIRVQKFSGIKSWGLALKLNELGLDEKVYSKFKAGQDLTDLLGIKKYEPEEDASPSTSPKAYPKWVKFCLRHFLTRWIGRAWQNANRPESGGFPTELISKSDETTVQNYKGVLEKFADEKVYVSAKMEGQSVTAVLPLKKNGKLGDFYVCSRTRAYKKPTNNDFWKAAKDLDVEAKLTQYFKNTGDALIIQAEQCGPGIQHNIYKFNELHWFVYTIKKQTKDGGCTQLSLQEMQDVCKVLKFECVPMIEIGTLKDMMPTVDEAVKYAEKVYWKINVDEDGTLHRTAYEDVKKGDKMWKDYAQHEGVVVRSLNYDKDRNIGVSFKVKNIDYAEKGLGEIASIEW